MKKLLAALVLAIGFWNDSTAAESTSNETITFVFLNTGVSPKSKGISDDEVRKMQAQHVGNFGTQFDLGTLIAAGPLGDNGFIRGTVVLTASTLEKGAEVFKPDPYVQNEILKAEMHPWVVDVMKFGPPRVPFQLAQHTLCIVKKGKNWKALPSHLTAESMIGLFPSLKGDARSGELAISGPFTDDGDKVGLMLFYSTNRAQIQARLEKEPALSEERVQIELHPQFLGKGTFRDPHGDVAPPKSGKRTKLFDGKTFNGWEGHTNNTWRIEKGAFVGGTLTATVPHNDFLCTTAEFKNFDLRLKVKLQGTGFVNGGIQLRSQRAKEPAFEMVGYQADMGEGYWASLYDESRRRKTLAHTHALVLKHIVKSNDWNDYVIRCSESFIPLQKLRHCCPCAGCKGEMDIMGNVYKNPPKPLSPQAFQLVRLESVGGYAVRPIWADGHATGLFSFDYLKRVADLPDA